MHAGLSSLVNVTRQGNGSAGGVNLQFEFIGEGRIALDSVST